MNGILAACQQAAALLPVALGVWFAFYVLRFPDFTFQGSFALGGVLFVATVGASPTWADLVIALLLAIIAGAVAGTATGAVNVILRVPTLIAGIGVSLVCYSAILVLMDGPNQGVSLRQTILRIASLTMRRGSDFDAGAALRSAVLQAIVLLVTAICALLIVRWVLTTRVGLLIRAAGSNPAAATRYRCRPGLWLICGLMLANGLAGFSGALFAQHVRFADVGFGRDVFGAALGATILSEAFLGGRSWTARLSGLFGGVLAFELTRLAVLASPVTSDYLRGAEGALLLAAVAISAVMRGTRPLEDLRL